MGKGLGCREMWAFVGEGSTPELPQEPLPVIGQRGVRAITPPNK